MYKLIRFYQNWPNSSAVVETGLTLEEAQAHCSDSQSSSVTCTLPEGVVRTSTFGPWFDGYTQEA